MNPDLFVRSLQGVGIPHDVDLFVEAYRGSGYSVAILADSADDALSSEAMIPVLRYLSKLGVSPLLLAGLGPVGELGAESFANRLTSLGVVTRDSSVRLRESWSRLIPSDSADEVHLVRVATDGEAVGEDFAERLAEIGCRKLVLLDAQGMVFEHGRPKSICLIDPAVRHDEIIGGVGIDPDQRSIVRFASRMTRCMSDQDITVSLASPLNILPELFTVRGAGTLFRARAQFSLVEKPASAVTSLKAIIERSFGRTLREAPSPFDHNEAWAVIEDRGRAAALLFRTDVGHYMSKFAVVRECQGSGMGQELWSEVIRHGAKVFWRSRNSNSISPWYAKIADGMIRSGEWAYYWRGLQDWEIEIGQRIALSQPQDFLE